MLGEASFRVRWSGGGARRKGNGRRRPCLHGMAADNARKAANGGPPRRRLQWSRASALYTFSTAEYRFLCFSASLHLAYKTLLFT